MISVSEARHLVQRNAPPRKRGVISLDDSLGRIIAGDIIARASSPRFSSSAMDGFAVRHADAWAQSAEGLAIVGESRAGEPFSGGLERGQAVRISTGAVLPDGAEAIVPAEDAEERGERVIIQRFGREGQFIRHAGDEYAAGATLLRAGTRIGIAQAALLAQEGVSMIEAFQSPRLAVVTTGDELVGYDREPGVGQIRDSNSVMLTAAARASGAELIFAERAPDDYRQIKQTLARAVENADITLTVGGASVGRHDWIKFVAAELGFETVFWQVRQKPGKPLFFARLGEKLLFGLPGNPVSALICYSWYAHPLVRHLVGASFEPRIVRGILASPLAGADGRAEFVRVRLEQNGVEYAPPLVAPVANQESYMLTSVTEADGFVFIDVGRSFDAGAVVDVVMF